MAGLKPLKKPRKGLTKKDKGMLRSAYRRAHAEKGIQRIREHHRPGEIYARAGVRSVASPASSTNTDRFYRSDPLLQKG